MQHPDPYTPDESVYECYQCGTRIRESTPVCPDCKGEVKNIAVTRE